MSVGLEGEGDGLIEGQRSAFGVGAVERLIAETGAKIVVLRLEAVKPARLPLTSRSAPNARVVSNSRFRMIRFYYYMRAGPRLFPCGRPAACHLHPSPLTSMLMANRIRVEIGRCDRAG